MTETMTLTEFNQRRSRALRTVRAGGDVIVRSERPGDEDLILITKLNKPWSTLARGLADGSITPPTKRLSAPLHPAVVDPERARAALAEFEAEREF